MEQGVRQGYVLFPLLFNVVLAAVLTVVLRKFSENTAILAELVQMKKPTTSMGPEPAMDYVVGCGISCMRMTPVLIFQSPQELAKMMEVTA